MSDKEQDFFFDEDESTPEAPAGAKASSKAGASKSAGKPSQAAPTVQQTVSMTTAALIGVVALLGGVIIGILLPTGGSPAPTTTGAVQGVVPDQTQAPQLTPEQLQGGELPQGHPDIGSMGGSTGATDSAGGSVETTGN